MLATATPLQIRPVPREDWPAAFSCGEVFFAERKLPGRFSLARSLEVWGLAAAAFPHVIIGVYADAQIVGGMGVLIVQDDWSDHRFAPETFWFLRPEYRCSTAALRCLREAEQWIRAAAVRDFRVAAFHGEDFDSLSAIYQRLGFVPWRTEFRKELSDGGH